MTYIAKENSSDQAWRDDIFVQTKFFADFQVKKFNLLANDIDTKQEAYLGLWEAIITFDYHKNFDFYRWAQWNILKKIRDSRNKTKRFYAAKSSIKEGLNNCNSTDDLYEQEVMLESGYLYKQLIIDNKLKLSTIQLDVLLKNVLLGKKLREIASDHKLSIERIRQIRNFALGKLKGELS